MQKPDGANGLYGLVVNALQVSFGSFDKQRPAASAFTRIIKFHLIHMMNTQTGETANQKKKKTQYIAGKIGWHLHSQNKPQANWKEYTQLSFSRSVLKANKTFIWLQLVRTSGSATHMRDFHDVQLTRIQQDIDYGDLYLILILGQCCRRDE